MNLTQKFLALERHLLEKECRGIERQQKMMRTFGTSEVQFQFNLWRKSFHLRNHCTLLFCGELAAIIIKNAAAQQFIHCSIASTCQRRFLIPPVGNRKRIDRPESSVV